MACGFDLACALTVHHKVPKAFGGGDAESNLTTLCANCHKLVHWLSIGSRLDAKEGQVFQKSLSRSAYAKVHELAQLIRDHSREVKKSGNRWLQGSDASDPPIDLVDALDAVAHRNKLTAIDTDSMKDATELVLDRIPIDVRRSCAFRVPRQRQFFSVNVGNILLYRTPGYADGAKRADADLFIIWPGGTRPSVIPKEGWEDGATFAAIPCFNLSLTFHELFALTNRDWRLFAKACRDAAGVSRARPRVSNVLVPE